MGTYTTNYQLYMPTVGETGWGTLVNTNFSTIDTTMKGLNNRITAVENEVNGNLSCTSVTTSGKITGNGGIAGTTGTFSGAVTAASFKPSNVTVVTVTASSNWMGTGNRTSSATRLDDGLLNVLPFNPFFVYSGTLKSVCGTSYPTIVVIVNENNTTTYQSLNTKTDETPEGGAATAFSFTRAKSVSLFSDGGWTVGLSICSIPILTIP